MAKIVWANFTRLAYFDTGFMAGVWKLICGGKDSESRGQRQAKTQFSDWLCRGASCLRRSQRWQNMRAETSENAVFGLAVPRRLLSKAQPKMAEHEGRDKRKRSFRIGCAEAAAGMPVRRGMKKPPAHGGRPS